MLAMVLVGMFASACAEEEFPNRDIEWFVGFNAGGGFDVASRIIADKMSDDLGVDVVVRNIPGGGGRRAVQEISRGEPDGYSISIVNMPNQITAELLDPEGVDFNSIGWVGRAVIQTYGMYTAADTTLLVGLRHQFLSHAIASQDCRGILSWLHQSQLKN